jgi:non-ribosomal peptide synthetase component F
MGRRLAGAPQQLAVVVVLDRYRFACSCRLVLFLVLKGGRLVAVIEAVGMAPRRTVRVTAEAGVATFHQIPPGP